MYAEWMIVISNSLLSSLIKAIAMEVLADDEEYEEILEDMREECCKFGMLIYFSRLGKTTCCLAEKMILSLKLLVYLILTRLCLVLG